MPAVMGAVIDSSDARPRQPGRDRHLNPTLHIISVKSERFKSRCLGAFRYSR
jgi:hypothetical protein